MSVRTESGSYITTPVVSSIDSIGGIRSLEQFKKPINVVTNISRLLHEHHYASMVMSASFQLPCVSCIPST